MMSKRHMQTIYIITIMIPSLVIALSLVTSVAALGIAPSLRIINYDNQSHTITGEIVNTEAQNITISLSIAGDLAGYTRLGQNSLMLSSNDAGKLFNYSIELPEGLSPGAHEAIITATESSTGINSATEVGAGVSVSQVLQVNVPYTGLYATTFLSTSGSSNESPVTITASIENIGTQAISEAYGDISVSDSSHTIYRATTPKIYSIAPGSSGKIDYSWTPNIAPGEYNIEYTLHYNGKTSNMSRQIGIGDYSINITGASVGNFVLGTVARLEINLSSGWNDPIPVSADVSLVDSSGRVIKSTSARTTLNKNDIVVAYLDTEGINAGRYNLTITMHYGSKDLKKTYISSIGENSITLTSKTAKPRSSGGPIYYIFAGLVIITVAVMLILRRHKHRKKSKI